MNLMIVNFRLSISINQGVFALERKALGRIEEWQVIEALRNQISEQQITGYGITSWNL